MGWDILLFKLVWVLCRKGFHGENNSCPVQLLAQDENETVALCNSNISCAKILKASEHVTNVVVSFGVLSMTEGVEETDVSRYPTRPSDIKICISRTKYN